MPLEKDENWGTANGSLREKRLNSEGDAGSKSSTATLHETDNSSLNGLGFGEVLRHELNNPLTGILGNAELLLVELRRSNVKLAGNLVVRVETIASLAVRMRETVRRLTEELETYAGLPLDGRSEAMASKFRSRPEQDVFALKHFNRDK